MSDLQTLITAHKAIQRGEPAELANMFIVNSTVRAKTTKQDHQFQLPRPRLETGRRRFGYRAAALLNRLPGPNLTKMGTSPRHHHVPTLRPHGPIS